MDEELDHDAAESPIAELLIGVGLIGLALYMIIEGLSYPAGKGGDPGSFAIPLLVATLMVIAGGVLILKNIRKAKAADGVDVLGLAKENVKVFIFLGILLFAAVALPLIGYTVTMFLVLGTITKTLGAGWIRSTLVSLLGSVGSYYLFQQMFSVPLPSGFLGF